MVYAQVIVAKRSNVEELTYAVPAKIIPYIRAGSTVTVPLRQKFSPGVVVKLQRQIPRELRRKVRDIQSVQVDTGFSSAQIKTIHQLADFYGAGLAEVAFHALKFPGPLAREKIAARPKPLFIQAAWPERINYYRKIIDKHPDKKIVLVFSVEGFAREFAQTVEDIGPDRVISTVGRVFNREDKSRLASDHPYVIVGQQNIVFAPLSPGDILIVDQPDHVGAKQQQRPYMTTKRIALARAQAEGVQVVLGSDLLSPIDYPKVKTAEWRYRTQKVEPGTIAIFSRQRSPFLVLPSLEEMMARDWRAGKRLLVMAASKTWSPAVVCRNCSQVLSCPRCGRTISRDVSTQLRCNYCQEITASPKRCPHCQSQELINVGEGTAQLEEYFKKTFSSANVITIDSSSRHLPSEEAQITIATEKILSFPDQKYDAAYLLSLDRFLSGADVNDLWHMLYLLRQLRTMTTTVAAQTYFPDHQVWSIYSTGDLERFYADEIAKRRQYNLPPYGQQFSALGTVAKNQPLSEAKQIVERLEKNSPHVVGQPRLLWQGREELAEIPMMSKKPLSVVQKKLLRRSLPPAWTLDFEKNQL